MKKKISLILAFLMAASMLAGCKKTNEDSSGLPDVGGADATTSSLTQMTTTEETTTEKTTTETTTEETEETEETTTEASETSETSETSTAAAETMSEKSWSETEISETMYIKTVCYSREKAIVGSEAVKKYEAGTKIEVVAATDTGYYKLADGTFIHSDYVTDTAPASKTTTTAAPETTTKKKTTTTAADGDEDTSSGSSKPISSNYNKSYKDRYPYQQLNSDEQQLYRNIVEAAESFDTKVDVPSSLLSDDIFKVYCIVYNNEPQLFWLSTSAPAGYGTVNLDFAMTRAEAEEAQKTIDARASEVLKKVNGYSSTISKLKVIHDWVVTHNDFSLQGTYATCGIYNGLGGHGELQCQGYAKTTQYLCDLAGIECMTVVGNNTEGSTHAWNVVYCENGYYILDTTWDDPYNSKGYNTSSYVRHVLFLANDNIIKNSHLNQSTATRGNGTRIKLYDPPACTSSSCYYFKAYDKEYSDLDSAVKAFYEELDAVIASGTQAVHIRVSDHKLWEKLMSDSYAKEFQKYAKSKDSKITGLGRQKTLTEDALVVEYDIRYN